MTKKATEKILLNSIVVLIMGVAFIVIFDPLHNTSWFNPLSLAIILLLNIGVFGVVNH